jgi:hypothetical protein
MGRLWKSASERDCARPAQRDAGALLCRPPWRAIDPALSSSQGASEGERLLGHESDSAGWLLAGVSPVIGKHPRRRSVGVVAACDFMPKWNSEPLRCQPTTRVPRLALLAHPELVE